MEKRLYQAVANNDLATVKELAQHPELDINCQNPQHFGRFTVLQAASAKGFWQVVSALLDRPDLAVNQQNSWDGTAMLLACFKGRLEVVKLLLRDFRVNLNLADFSGCTPLWWACQCDHLEIIRWMLASGRRLDLAQRGRFYGREMTPLAVAQTNKREEMEDLLSRFLRDPITTRHQLRVTLGLHHTLAAELFALVVFTCEDILAQVPSLTSTKAARFFASVRRLPQELQMVICNQCYDVDRQFVSLVDSGVALQTVAANLLSQR